MLLQGFDIGWLKPAIDVFCLLTRIDLVFPSTFKSSSYMGILDFLWYTLPMNISPSLSFFVVVFTLFIVFLPCKSCWIFFFNCPWVLSDSWKVLPYTQVIEESNPCCPLVPIINFFFTFRYLIDHGETEPKKETHKERESPKLRKDWNRNSKRKKELRYTYKRR